MSEVDWQETRRRRGSRGERRECVDAIERGAAVLLAEARARGEESLTLGLEEMLRTAERLRSLLESASEPSRRTATPSAPSPAVEARAEGAPAATAADLPDGPAGGSPAILVVDDNPLNREMLRRRLEGKGYRVVEAADGSEALATLAARRFDLVLLDIMMPGLSGTDVLAKVRETRSLSDLPVIMATAKDSSEDVLQSLKLGANDYVTKPLDFPIVHARVEVQLAYKRAKDEAQRLARDLFSSNRRLEEVQRRLVELQQGATGATQGLAAWTRAMAEGISPLVGVPEIAVFSADEKGVHPLGPASLAAPTPLELEEARKGPVERSLAGGGARTLLAVLGPLGELHGGVVVPARVSTWAQTERQLLESFVRNLGTALDFQKVRSRLAQVEESRARTRQEMLARGIDVLALCPACGYCASQDETLCPADGAALHGPRLLPHRVDGRYRLVHLIGEGGMGTVFEAYDERLSRSVAVKILRNDLFETGEGLLRFGHEARAAAGIDHPGVIRVFDSGDLEDGSAFLVMELVSGINLKDVLDRCGRGSCRQAASLVRQGAAALEAAHAAGILHRDVKPENFILTRTPDGFLAKLVDFGVAKSMHVDTSVTRAGTVLGTPRYMSPEQVQDRPLDARSDLYSFAVVCYEALAGFPVVEEGSLASVMMDVAVKKPLPITKYLPWLPAEVVAAFEHAFAKSPADRPASPAAWAGAFAGVLESTPDEAPGWVISGTGSRGEHAPTRPYDVTTLDATDETRA